MIIVSFRWGKGRSEGEVVKHNYHTMLVRFRCAGRTKVIKRHARKHALRFEQNLWYY